MVYTLASYLLPIFYKPFTFTYFQRSQPQHFQDPGSARRCLSKCWRAGRGLRWGTSQGATGTRPWTWWSGPSTSCSTTWSGGCWMKAVLLWSRNQLQLTAKSMYKRWNWNKWILLNATSEKEKWLKQHEFWIHEVRQQGIVKWTNTLMYLYFVPEVWFSTRMKYNQ